MNTAEAREILTNARAAYDNGLITREQYEDVRAETLKHIAIMYELVIE